MIFSFTFDARVKLWWRNKKQVTPRGRQVETSHCDNSTRFCQHYWKNPWQRKTTELGKWLSVNQRELFVHRRHWLVWTPLLIQAEVIILETFGIMAINLLHSNISMHIPLKVLSIFPMMLTGRICLTIKSLFSWWSFPLFSWCRRVIQGWSCDSHS